MAQVRYVWLTACGCVSLGVEQQPEEATHTINFSPLLCGHTTPTSAPNRFAYLSQPLLRDSAAGIVQHWQQEEGDKEAGRPKGGLRQSALFPASSSSRLSRLASRLQRLAVPIRWKSRHAVLPGDDENDNSVSQPSPVFGAQGSRGHLEEDDAFGTILQWLYAKSLQLQHHKQRQHVRHPQ